MSLSRAFTTRRVRKASDVDLSIPIPQRSLTTKQSGMINREQISAPIELLSTTNMLSYNAPDIYPRTRSSTTSSTNSDSRSTNSGSDTSPSSVGTPFTSPETSSIESSPITSSPQPNHLSCYFNANIVSDEEAPQLPTRAPSHTKKSAEYLARKKSMSRMVSPKNSISSRVSKHTVSTSRSSYNNLFHPSPEVEQHPFGQELAQVSELVEEYSASKEKLAIVDEEEQELISKGLFKFAAEDYMSELTGLFANAFSDKAPPMHAMWI